MIDDQDRCEWVNVSSGTGSPGLFAGGQVHWYRNDQLLRPSRRHEMKLTRDGVCSLRIRDVTADDAGKSPLLSVFLHLCVRLHLLGSNSVNVTAF